MLSELAETILLALENNKDPMTSDELANGMGCHKSEVVMAINELKSIEAVVGGPTGYKLSEPTEDSDEKKPTAPGGSPFERVIYVFATMKKRAFVKGLAKASGCMEVQTRAIVQQLLTSGVIDVRSPGTHYLTKSGVDFVKQNYPDILVPEYVVFNAENPPANFTIKSNAKMREKIPALTEKLSALSRVLPLASPEDRKQLSELSTLLQA